jgi:hypothetical protein
MATKPALLLLLASTAACATTPVQTGVQARVHKVVILHDGNASNGDPCRKEIVELLDSMKASHHLVVELRASPTRAEDLKDAALIIIGPNARMFGENHPDPGLRTIAVPVMVSKDGNTSEVGLGKARATDPPTFNQVVMLPTAHPLGAGLPPGTVTVLTTPDRQRIIGFSAVGPDAIKIATDPQNPDAYAIVGYDKGADMGNGLRAPAKRVGFFWHRPAATTAEGTRLFKAAVDWLLRP